MRLPEKRTLRTLIRKSNECLMAQGIQRFYGYRKLISEKCFLPFFKENSQLLSDKIVQLLQRFFSPHPLTPSPTGEGEPCGGIT